MSWPATKLGSLHYFFVFLVGVYSLYFKVIEAKQERMSVQLDHWFTSMKDFDRRFASIEGLVGEVVRDVQGLKNRLDMVYVQQDRIQSTLAGRVPPSRIFRLPSIDAAVMSVTLFSTVVQSSFVCDTETKIYSTSNGISSTGLHSISISNNVSRQKCTDPVYAKTNAYSSSFSARIGLGVSDKP